MAFRVSVEKARQGWVNSLGLASLNTFDRLGVGSHCLVPGPEMIKTDENCLLGCTEQTDRALDWFLWSSNSMLFAVSKN